MNLSQETALQTELRARWPYPADPSNELLRSGFYAGATWSFANPLEDIIRGSYAQSAWRAEIELHEQSSVWRAGFELGALWARRFEATQGPSAPILEGASQ